MFRELDHVRVSEFSHDRKLTAHLGTGSLVPQQDGPVKVTGVLGPTHITSLVGFTSRGSFQKYPGS